MSKNTCRRHPVTGWNNGSHYINTQPDNAIKWRNITKSTSTVHLTTGHGVYSSPSMCFCTSAPTQRTERGSCAELTAHDPFIGTEHLSYWPQSLLTAAVCCLPSITALIMPTKAEGALWLVPRLSLALFHSFSMEALKWDAIQAQCSAPVTHSIRQDLDLQRACQNHRDLVWNTHQACRQDPRSPGDEDEDEEGCSQLHFATSAAARSHWEQRTLAAGSHTISRPRLSLSSRSGLLVLTVTLS